jgi:pimeloyl-ACP methyl ester carboxylesterase
MMTEVEIEGFGGVRIRAYRSPSAESGDHLVIALPLATRPSFCERAVASLAGRFNVITWEARLMLAPQVGLPDREALSIASHIEDVNVILDHLGVAQAHLLGYCSGAAMALHVAGSSNGRFRRLVLVNGAYFTKPEECEHTQYERDILALAPQIAADRVQASYLFSRFFEGNRSFRRREHEFAEEIYRPYDNLDSFYRFGVGLDNFIASDSRRVAGEIAIPTLVTSGGLDDQTHASSSAMIASQIAGSETYFDETGDHYELCRAKPALINRVMSFLTNG